MKNTVKTKAITLCTVACLGQAVGVVMVVAGLVLFEKASGKR